MHAISNEKEFYLIFVCLSAGLYCMIAFVHISDCCSRLASLQLSVSIVWNNCPVTPGRRRHNLQLIAGWLVHAALWHTYRHTDMQTCTSELLWTQTYRATATTTHYHSLHYIPIPWWLVDDLLTLAGKRNNNFQTWRLMSEGVAIITLKTGILLEFKIIKNW